jgi:SSS family solute:Na+ symporter/sodium/proline symporter
VVGYLLPDVAAGFLLPLVAAFVIVYTALAGMQSVARTDLVNGILMTVGILVALAVALSAAGGVGEVLAQSAAATTKGPETSAYSLGDILSVLLPSFLLLLGDANMHQRFFSARSAAAARRSALGMFCGVLLLELAIIALALCGAALIQAGRMPAPDNPGHVIVHMAFTQIDGAPLLPLPLGALLAATVLAVIVSTADSYLLAPATALVRDILQRFLRPDLAEIELVRASRLTVVILGLCALGLAYLSDRFFGVALFAYTLYGAGITPALLAALFWRRATPAAAVASMVLGVVVALGWKYGGWGDLLAEALAARAGGAAWNGWDDVAAFIESLHAVVPAALASSGALVLGSLAGGRRPRG